MSTNTGEPLPAPVTKRVEIHAARVIPSKKNEEVNEAINAELAELEGLKEATEQAEKKLAEANQKTLDTEARLADAQQKLQVAEARLAEMERQEALFTQEHQQHDVGIQDLIQKNLELSEQQLQRVRRILGKNPT